MLVKNADPLPPMPASCLLSQVCVVTKSAGKSHAQLLGLPDCASWVGVPEAPGVGPLAQLRLRLQAFISRLSLVPL